ncbi:MAG: hypothetical protein U0835_16270 [Isosphaeraceae bacterium]
MVLNTRPSEQNRITQAGYQALARQYDAGINSKALGRPDDESRQHRTAARLPGRGGSMRCFLFAEEPKLDAPVKGTSGFAEVFPKHGPRDSGPLAPRPRPENPALSPSVRLPDRLGRLRRACRVR